MVVMHWVRAASLLFHFCSVWLPLRWRRPPRCLPLPLLPPPLPWPLPRFLPSVSFSPSASMTIVFGSVGPPPVRAVFCAGGLESLPDLPDPREEPAPTLHGARGLAAVDGPSRPTAPSSPGLAAPAVIAFRWRSWDQQRCTRSCDPGRLCTCRGRDPRAIWQKALDRWSSAGRRRRLSGQTARLTKLSEPLVCST
ncbi:unnamed protein product [Prorocentrum cordatum]|uniref:Secreted protein n=1 Tax=Prorocentrum cordatum TaxID=2364126 RepID=A0ABN9QRI6_9DINO|nr:unnamed protein product [Polarella glacialis]